MDMQLIIVIVLALLGFGVVAFAVLAPTNKDKANKRISSIEGGKASSLRGASAANAEAATKDRRRKLNQALSNIEDQQKQIKKKKRLTLEQRIERSGLTIEQKHFYMGAAIAGVALAFIGFIGGLALWQVGLMGLIGAFGLPNWFIGFQTSRRQKKFENEFSNAIDVIVRGVKSGLPVNECLKIIATEAPAPVNEEFHMLTEGIRIGLSLEQCLDRMYERMPLQEVSFFGIVLMIQQKTGGNLGEALGNLSSVLRGRKLMAGKIKALSSEAKASAMIIGALPFLVMGAVHISSPQYLTPLWTTSTGNFIILGAGIWMSLGVFVMKQMMQIKV